MSAAVRPDTSPLAWSFADDLHWDRALLASSFPTPFQSAAWCDAWLETAGAQSGVIPRLLRLPATGAIRLGLAMQVEATPCGGKRLSPLSAPWCDYQEAVGEGATPADVDAAAFWLRRESASWGAPLIFQDVVPGGTLASILEHLPGRFQPSTPVVAVDLRDGERLAQLCGRNEHRIKRRRLARLGALSLRHCRSPADVPAALARFVDLHRRQWAGRQDAVAPFTETGVRETFEAVANRCAAAGLLAISELQCGERTIASYLGFLLGNRYFAYRTAFERELHACSPGHILLQDLLCDFGGQGIAHFDLMRGGYAYKADYGSVFGQNLAWMPEAP